MMTDGVRSLLGYEETTIDKESCGTIELTKKESEKLSVLKKNILATMDNKTAITSISVTLQNSKVTAIVADSVIHKLQEYIINYRTFKAKEIVSIWKNCLRSVKRILYGPKKIC